MKYDEFAFFNRQLANMLRDGIPLEGALRQLCKSMRRGPLRAELEALEADLAAGTPLGEALASRRLPDVYVRMVEIGARSNNLSGVLTLLADHYENQNYIWTRLKGVLVYPAIVLLASLGLSIFFLVTLFPAFQAMVSDLGLGPHLAMKAAVYVIFPPVLLTGVVFVLACCLSAPGLRRSLSWSLPPFKDAKLAQTASAMSIMLRGGCTLDEALGMLGAVEAGSAASGDLARWQECLAAGRTGFAEITSGSRVFPRMFTWLVTGSGEDLADGFDQAAKMYREQAAHRIEMMLYGALPGSVLVLGALVFTQVQGVFSLLTTVMQSMGA